MKRIRFLLRVALLSCFYWSAAVLAGAGAEYRWIGGTDTNWNTVANWQVFDGEAWQGATAAPGQDDTVRLTDAAPNSAQQINIAGDTTVLSIFMEATGDRQFTIGGTPTHLFTATTIEVSSGASQNMVFGTLVHSAGTVATNGILVKSAEGRAIFNQPVTGPATNNPVNMRGEASFIGIAQFNANTRFTFWGNQNTLVTYSSSTLPVLRSFLNGSTNNSLFFSQSYSNTGGEGDISLFTATTSLSILDGGSNDVTVTMRNVNRGGTVNLINPTDGSSGIFTLNINDIRAASGIWESTAFTLESATRLQLRGNQETPVSVAVAGGISGAGALIKDNNSTSDIGDQNTYTGGTFIRQGALRLISATIPESGAPEADTVTYSGHLGAGDLHITAGASFLMNDLNQTVTALRNDTSTGTGGSVDLGAGSAGTLTLNGSGTHTFAGNIAGTGEVVYQGNGTQIFTGSNSFSGDFVVASGEVLVNGSFSTGIAVLVGSQGTLGGTGLIEGSTAIAGTLSPGNSAGTLTFDGDLLFDSGAAITFDIGSDGSDLIEFSGSSQQLASDGPLLWTFVANGTVELDTAYTLMDWSGATGFDAMDFSLLDQTITNAGWDGFFSGDVNGLYVTFTAIPEPSTIAFLFGIGAFLLVRIYRR